MPTTKQLRVEAVPIEELHPWRDNPRFIRRDRLDDLKANIERDAEFMWRRPVLARSDGTIYAGNQRYRACVELGWKTIPAIRSDISEQLAQERGLRDNNAWGEWDDEALIAMVQELAEQDRATVDHMGFTEIQLRTILAESSAATPAPRDVVDRQPTQYDDDEEDDPDTAALRQPDERDGGDTFVGGTIKQIILQYKAAQFAEIVWQLDGLRGALEIDNNTDVVTRMLEWWHDGNVGRDA